MFCKICKLKSNKRVIATRSKKKVNLFHCKNCDFEFFQHDPSKKLTLNKLNLTRLKKAGLKVPSRNEDFVNGLNQSKIYIDKYIKENEKKKYILEIGCSFGYFLFALKRKGFKNIFGLEINETCKNFVNNNLKIKCYSKLENLKNKIFFDKIFLFYSFEYIPNPKEYLKNLLSILKKNGKIYIITPNKEDILKDLIPASKFKDFFYDINSVNYFSTLSLKNLAKKLKIRKFSVSTNQGYSLANLFQWFLHQKPVQSKYVGGDIHIENLIKDIKNKKSKQNILKEKIISLIMNSNDKYKKILSEHDFGNQIIFCIKKR